jgi:UDP-GlcNAc:undecaprenyl-phosphate GlcNAc-1-phosphate transferase
VTQYPDVPVLSLVSAFALAFASASLLTPAVRRLASRAGYVAHPSADRWHQRSVTLLGGVAIWLATTVAAILLGNVESLKWPLLAGTAMFGLGVIDDVRALKPSGKLAIQLVVACGFVLAAGGRPWLDSPALDAMITVVWFVAVTNAFNLIDNMDGLCAGIGAIAALAFCVSAGADTPSSLLAAALAGAASGFLLYNFNPASIFMGDSGSLFIGSTLAAVTLSVEHRQTTGVVSTLAFPVVLMLIPIFDTSFVTIVRRLSNRAASVGGRDHTSHRLVALGFPERHAVLLLYGFAALAGATAIALGRAALEAATLLTGLLVLGLVLLGVRLARVNVYGGQDFAMLRDKRYTPLLVEFTYRRRVFEVLLDLCLASFAYYASYAIRFDQHFTEYYGLLVTSLPIVVASEIAGLSLAGVYKGFWRHVTLADLSTYIKGVGLGTVGAVLVLVYLYRFEGYSRGVFIINALLLGCLLVGSRLSFRAISDLANRHREQGRRTLIYGAGEGGSLLLRELRSNPAHDCRVIAFLDDDPGKCGRRLANVPILGGSERLGAIMRDVGAELIIVSTALSPESVHRLLSASSESGVQVLRLELRLGELFPPHSERAQTHPTVPALVPASEAAGPTTGKARQRV